MTGADSCILSQYFLVTLLKEWLQLAKIAVPRITMKSGHPHLHKVAMEMYLSCKSRLVEVHTWCQRKAVPLTCRAYTVHSGS